MALKKLWKYETVVIHACGPGKKRNEDAETAIQILMESNDEAIKIESVGYKTDFGARSTLATLCPKFDNCCMPVGIDNDTYLVKAEYFNEFKNLYGSGMGRDRMVNVVSHVKSTPVHVNVPVVPKVIVEKEIAIVKKNSELLTDIKNIWNTGVQYKQISLSNMGGIYRPIIENILSCLNSKLALENFSDYLGLASNDGDMLYVVNDIISSKIRNL